MDMEDYVISSFYKIQNRISALSIPNEKISILDSLNTLQVPRQRKILTYIGIGIGVFVLKIALIVGLFLALNPEPKKTLIAAYLRYYGMDMNTSVCAIGIETYPLVMAVARPPVDCSFCRGIKEPLRLRNLSPQEFVEQYAYGGQPVVIEDAMKNWTAQKSFSYKFFKQVYASDEEILDKSDSCQFFGYATEFYSLRDVLTMDKRRANFMNGTKPWYIGWSNCVPEATNTLRQHYDRPYFLPADSESSKTDWIFMGSPGYGAPMHIDDVRDPSWQAQIKGTKVWIIEPPPECYSQCTQQMAVTIRPGETIVIDTNKWFHSTNVVGDDISITIGSEYD